jgi:outer membrane cobalamin receptor
LLLASAFAADLKIKVLDPQSAAVSGAQVELVTRNHPATFLITKTSSEGIAVFRAVSDDDYSVIVLAPGFAQQSVDASPEKSDTVTVQLQLAPASETVSVSATRNPVPSEAVGANVETLTAGQLTTMNPVAMNDAVRFLPGAVINTAGQRGGLSSLFVRGGESRYNKVIIDGVPVDEPGGTFDFGTVPVADGDRLEFLRGAQSTLYGSDAMTSVVQFWTRTGHTTTPELTFGADGGNLYTAHGYASLAGLHGPFDYNLFADQFNTIGQGINNDYSNSLQGGNVGYAINDNALLRVRVRHSNSRTGVSGEWNFNGAPLQPPDTDQRARQNNLLGSVELDVAASPHWQNRFTGFAYHHQRENLDDFADPGRLGDFPTHAVADINRAGFAYQGNYQERTWSQTTFGYEFEDENGFIGDLDYPNPPFPTLTHGLRLNHAFYGQQLLILGRLTVVAGARFQHIGTFGNSGLPRVALTLQALHGGSVFSGTSLRFTYATGFKEPTLDQTFAGPPFSVPNLNLRPERNRSFEAGIQQGLWQGKYSFIATYFNNLFHDRIDYATDPVTFVGQYVNVDKSFSQGAELEFQGKLMSRLTLNSAYTYTSTQNLEAPLCTPANFCDPVFAAGTPLLRRPKHSGSLLLNYLGHRWGGNLGGSFIGRRPDSDFLGFNILHAAGYARVDLGGWYAITSRITAYLNVENALNKHYNEVVGYPALLANFRAGFRFRIGGE